MTSLTWRTEDFKLESGQTLPELALAFLFPPSLAPGVMAGLRVAGGDARYVEIDTEFGHSASGADWSKWAPALSAFLSALGE